MLEVFTFTVLLQSDAQYSRSKDALLEILRRKIRDGIEGTREYQRTHYACLSNEQLSWNSFRSNYTCDRTSLVTRGNRRNDVLFDLLRNRELSLECVEEPSIISCGVSQETSDAFK